MHACIHMYIHTDKHTHIHIITDVLCMLGISHGHDLNSLYRGNRVSWSFAHGVSCLFFAHDLQETKEWRAAMSELQDSMIRPPTQGTCRPFAQAPPLDQWYQWFFRQCFFSRKTRTFDHFLTSYIYDDLHCKSHSPLMIRLSTCVEENPSTALSVFPEYWK